MDHKYFSLERRQRRVKNVSCNEYKLLFLLPILISLPFQTAIYVGSDFRLLDLFFRRLTKMQKQTEIFEKLKHKTLNTQFFTIKTRSTPFRQTRSHQMSLSSQNFAFP